MESKKIKENTDFGKNKPEFVEKKPFQIEKYT